MRHGAKNLLLWWIGRFISAVDILGIRWNFSLCEHSVSRRDTAERTYRADKRREMGSWLRVHGDVYRCNILYVKFKFHFIVVAVLAAIYLRNALERLKAGTWDSRGARVFWPLWVFVLVEIYSTPVHRTHPKPPLVVSRPSWILSVPQLTCDVSRT